MGAHPLICFFVEAYCTEEHRSHYADWDMDLHVKEKMEASCLLRAAHTIPVLAASGILASNLVTKPLR